MALGIRDYCLFIRYLDFRACAEYGLSHICVCIMTMARAKVSSCGCQGFTQTLLLFFPHTLCTQRSCAISSLLSFFQSRLASIFQGNHSHCPLPSCSSPSITPLLCPLPRAVGSSLPMLSQPSRCASSCFTCPPQENGDLAGSSSAGGAFLQSFLGNSSQYVGNC